MTASPIDVLEAGPEDRAAWEEFVAGSGGSEAGHAWGFHEVLERVFGTKTHRLAALREGRWVGALPLVSQKSVFGRFLTSVPYLNYAGVLGDDPEGRRALAGRALRLAEEMSAHRLELRGRDGSDLPIESWEGKAGYVLALPSESEVLWDALGAKVRSQVRRPQKDGYRASVASHRGLDAFHPLLARRWHEMGSPVLPRSFFAEMEREFGEDIEYVLVEKDGRAVAAGTLLRFGGRIEIPWAASDIDHDRFGVNMLLYWACLERATARGAREFDFGRSTPGSGNARFKIQWKASERVLRWNVRVRDARGHSTERGTGRREAASWAWRHLPRSVATRLGPFLAARIPL